MKRLASQRQVILKLRLGEDPPEIPAFADVRRGATTFASHVDGGPLDRIFRKFTGATRAVRVFSSKAANCGRAKGNERFDDLEHRIGLSRTLRIDSADPVNVYQLSDALRQISVVEDASPCYLCKTPFAAAAAVRAADAWQPRRQIHVAEALAYEPGDPAVIVAVLDTGVRTGHPELSRTRRGYDSVNLGSGDIADGLELVGDVDQPDSDADDREVGHGTACAGIIGALGVDMPPGAAGECGILPVRVLGAARFGKRESAVGLGALPDIDVGMKFAVDMGAKVLNMSFGTAGESVKPGESLPHEDVVSYALERGCILIAASGNSGEFEKFFPAALDGVIAVGSVDAHDRPSSFTTRGDHVAFCAPGERVLSSDIGGYNHVTGTSFAAPFATAAAALLVSRAMRRSFTLDSALTKEILRMSARAWGANPPKGCGAGVLDVCAALRSLDQAIDIGGGSSNGFDSAHSA
jgi:subtilisin family serine protease